MSLEFQYHISLFSLYIPGCVLVRILQGGGRGWWADKMSAISHSLIIRLGEILEGKYLPFWMLDVSGLIGVF
jgi:phage gp46-like protein